METNQSTTYEWMRLIITIVTIVIAIITIIKGYQEYKRSLKQKRVELFVRYREKLRNNAILKNILELLAANNIEGIQKLSKSDKYFFIGFYEEVALMVNSKIMRPEIAHYMFAHYAKMCLKNEEFWLDINKEGAHWRVFHEFVEQMVELEKKIVNIPKDQKNRFQI